MSQRLRFKHHLRPACVGPDLVFLLSERDQFMLRGRLYGLLAPLLDGSRGERELVNELSGAASPPEVLYALNNLREKGYLAASAPEIPPAALAFWQSIDVDPALAESRLAATPVGVEAVGGLDLQPLRSALAGAGVRVDDEAGVRLVLTPDYLLPELESFNGWAQKRGGPRWMPIKPTGIEAWIGPMIRPGAGFCWACIAHRVRANRPVDLFIQRRTGGARDLGGDGGGDRDPDQAIGQRSLAPPEASLAASSQAALTFAAVAIARWIAEGEKGSIDGALLALDFARFRLTSHAVTRRPQCPACGEADLLSRRAERPLVLQSRPKRFTEDGGHRIASPEQTLEAAYDRHVSPITGVISAIAVSQGSDAAMRPVYGGVFPVCPRGDSPALSDFHQSSMGKGRSAAQARASALGEAIERWSSLFQGDEPRIRARIADLGDEAVQPGELLHYSEAQYRARGEINAAARDVRSRIPEPFDPSLEIEWTPVWSLSRHRRRYLPTAYCYNNYPRAPASRVFPDDSNGNAAGNCVEEAILQGFFELVERDSVALWWYSRSARPGVELQSFGEPYLEDLEAHYRALGWKLWVLDVTSDLGIPAFAALAAGPSQRLVIGFGCHFEARLGVQRALTELNQLFLADRALAEGQRSFIPETQGYLFPDPKAPRRSGGDYPTYTSDDIKDDVLACVERAAAVGLETLVLDQSRPDVSLCAVKVTVPGLRHFWPRFGPGRLYEVPRRLGWQTAPLREEDLNPTPIFW